MDADALELPVLTEVDDADRVGTHLGQVKWWNDRLGYGFITVCRGQDRGKDIFVHHTGVHPLSSHYRTLYKGEYVQFDIQQTTGSRGGASELPGSRGVEGGYQAVNVTGVDGGCLMCDVAPLRRYGVGGGHPAAMWNRSGTTS
jgi:cold shock CspA family protein